MSPFCRSRLILCSLFLACLLPTGCYWMGSIVAPIVIHQERVNVLNSSYAAADALSVLALDQGYKKSNPIDILDLVEKNHPKTGEAGPNYRIGPLLSSQMRRRFVDLGYNVRGVASYGRGGDTQGEVTGTYEFVGSRFKGEQMLVSLLFTDKTDGRTLAVYNYTLPVTYDLRKYMANDAFAIPPLFAPKEE